MGRDIFVMVFLGAISLIGSARADGEESLLPRYFDQLRQRGLFSLAESHAESRLADPQLAPPRRIELVIELSRTLVAHALSASDDQQPDLWQRASSVLTDELAVADDMPRRILLQVYLSLVAAERAEQLVFDLEASPDDESQRKTLSKITADALQLLTPLEKSLAETIRSLEVKKKSVPGITVHELRQLQMRVRLKSGLVLQAQARLSPAGTQERHSDVLDADEHFRKLLSQGDVEWQSVAKFGLAVGNRLRDDFERAMTMLEALEQEQKAHGGTLFDAVRIERARVLLMINQPHQTNQVLSQMRAGRDRLPGEFWLVHFEVLSALRRTAAQRSTQSLITDLGEQAQDSFKQVDAQIGGSWSRRCRAIWSAAESVERYGAQLAALLNTARGEYLASRMEPAIAAYSSAVDLAHQEGRHDVEMDVGYTLTAILTKAAQWDKVIQRSRQLVAAHPDHAKSPEIDLLAVYAHGQLSDHQPTPEHRAAYLRAITEHLRRFPQSSTASEAEYLRGRLLETSGQIVDARAAYELVQPDHLRSSAASAAVARCWVSQILQQRETGKHDAQLDQQSWESLSARLKTLPAQIADWNESHAELIYHSVRVMLLAEHPRFGDAEQWLNRLDEALQAAVSTGELSEIQAEVKRRMGPLRLIAFAGQGRPTDAEKLLGTLDQAGAVELLAVVEELSQIDIQQPAAAHRSLVEMQLSSAEALNRRRDELSAEQQRRLGLVLAKSYFTTSQPTNAVAVYQRLLEDRPKDIDLARQIGQILSSREELNCRTLARDCWLRIERSHKQGTLEWLEIRGRVIESELRLRNFDQARKLFKVTKLLYPMLGNAELRLRYETLESQLK